MSSREAAAHVSRLPHQPVGCFCPKTVQGTVHSEMKVSAAGRRGDIPTEVCRDSLPPAAVTGERPCWRGASGGDRSSARGLRSDSRTTALLPQQAGPERAGPRLQPALSHLSKVTWRLGCPRPARVGGPSSLGLGEAAYKLGCDVPARGSPEREGVT